MQKPTFVVRSPAVLDRAALVSASGGVGAPARPLPPVYPTQLQKPYLVETPEGWKRSSKPDKDGEYLNKPSSFSERLETWSTQRRYDKANKQFKAEEAAWEKANG